MKIGYVRVSSKDQNLARQIEKLKTIPVDKIFSEKESGKNIQSRCELVKLMKSIKNNDIIYVTSLDRLGRNAEDLTEIIQFFRKKGATLQSLDLPDFSAIPDLNLRNMLTDILITVFKFQAQSERERIRERQRQGIALAKKRGVYKGRPVLYSATSPNPKKRKIYFSLKKELKKGVSIRELAQKYKVSLGTILRIKKEI
ncbi:recombinase family protein [Ligilactobacillus sp. WILCCON 0076]|uniref:Recombinase family protein n=1 Tax=Ligilactobacillus ubinensis TaxID=2876789 RepID=A0A9X2FN11_9LACO|nr:recombinase family protein [Ligilactobacillus ubinensis]MCP0887451.1 recombinase family protein [Ligilactobacillus ubinensis]